MSPEIKCGDLVLKFDLDVPTESVQEKALKELRETPENIEMGLRELKCLLEVYKQMADESIWRVKKIYGLSIHQIDKVLKDKKENITESDPETKKEKLWNLLKRNMDKLAKKEIFDELSDMGIPANKLNRKTLSELRQVAYDHYHHIIYGPTLESLKEILEKLGYNVTDDVNLRNAQQMLMRHYEEEVKCCKDSKPVNTVNPSQQYNRDNQRHHERNDHRKEQQLEQRNEPQCDQRSARLHNSQNVSRPEQHEGHQNHQQNKQPNDQIYNSRTHMPTDPQMSQQSIQHQNQPQDRNENSGFLSQYEDFHIIYPPDDQTWHKNSFEARLTFPQMSQQSNQNQAQQQDQNQLPGRITGRRTTLSIKADLQIDE